MESSLNEGLRKKCPSTFHIVDSVALILLKKYQAIQPSAKIDSGILGIPVYFGKFLIKLY